MLETFLIALIIGVGFSLLSSAKPSWFAGGRMKKLILLIVFSLFANINSFADEGLIFDNKFHPGKFNFNYRHTETSSKYNAIWWSPFFKGGVGKINNNDSTTTNYIGGYIRPLNLKNDQGELILGFNGIDTVSGSAYEFQAEYRFPVGLAIGGGSVTRKNGGTDIDFGKVSFKHKNQNWNWIIETQYQEIATEGSLGGYIAAYDEQFMFTYGNDGEQWRSVLGYISPKKETQFRPALEFMLVENKIGMIDGGQFLFVNATLQFKGGFLSHPARLGRAMGPTGIEFGNPLGFLSTKWNRRLEAWELGGLADYRLVRTRTPRGVVEEKHEVLIYPFQFDKNKNIFDKFYIGGFKERTIDNHSLGVLGGFFGNVKFLQVGIGVDYNIDTNEKSIFVSFIDKF